MATEKDAIRLGKRIEFWQKRLEPLGLGHWRIDAVHVVDDVPNNGYRAAACVRPSVHYDYCEFWFGHEYLDNCNPRDLDITIIHEWLHVAMRNFDSAAESVEDVLASNVEEIWSERVRHERENLIDRLSRQIYVLWEADARAGPAVLRRLDRASLSIDG